MRIALVSTCALSTPPRKYGGTELVVAELAHGLIELGHQVLVYATGDSTPHGELRWIESSPCWPPSDVAERRHAAFAFGDLANADVDVVHVNDAAALPFSDRVRAPCVLTFHHPREQRPIADYLGYPSVAIVAISRRQAELLEELRVERVIHHGLDPARYPAGAGDGDYVAFLGRFAPEKAPHLAIRAAVSAKLSIRLGGDAHPVARSYFATELAPLLAKHRDRCTWLGELSHEPKLELLRGARALLQPLLWEEPFGLAMIEAMLVGTPVIAFARGSAPEIVDEGITGFLVRDAAEMTARIPALAGFDRARCRARAIERFSYLRMARDHVDLYEELISRPRRSRPSRGSIPGAEGIHARHS